MTPMAAPTVDELLATLRARIDVRLTAEQLLELDELAREESTVALVDLLCVELDNKTLQPNEVGPALALARAGQLLKSSAGLAVELAEYQRNLSAA